MADEKCLLDPNRECHGVKRAEEVASEVRLLHQQVSEFRQGVSDTNNRFGGRIGRLEAHNEVQDEQLKQIKESQQEIKKEVESARKEQKDSISELRREHKESMDDLKKGNKEILDAVTPLKHKVESLETLKGDVDELKEKPGKTWENIKSTSLGWIVALILVVLAVALGLGRYLGVGG